MLAGVRAWRLCCLLVFALTAAGCAVFRSGVTHTYGKKQLSPEFIAANIVKGKTTKAEVVALLGKPDSTMVMDYNMPTFEVPKYGEGGIVGSQTVDVSAMMAHETWTYSKIQLHQTGLNPKGFLWYAVTGTTFDSTKTSTLSIGFNKEGVVTTYTFMEM